MEVSPEEIVSVPTEVLIRLMKKVRRQAREISSLKRTIATYQEVISSHDNRWNSLSEQLAIMNEEIEILTDNMDQPVFSELEIDSAGHEDVESLSDALTDEHLTDGFFDVPD